MRKSIIFLAFAIVFVTLSFRGEVKAQSDPNGVPVWLTYNYDPYWGNNVRLSVEFYNKDISEDYHLETWTPQYDEPNTYRLGRVPPGNYRVSIVLIPSHSNPPFGIYFNWWAGSQYGNYLQVNSFEYTVLTEDIEIEEPFSSEPALHIYVEQH